MVRPKKTPISSSVARTKAATAVTQAATGEVKSNKSNQKSATKRTKTYATDGEDDEDEEQSNTDSNNETNIKTKPVPKSGRKLLKAGVPEEEELPRKRRMASLNAEFLVHYTSRSNNTVNDSNSNNLKRKRTISSNSVNSKSNNETSTLTPHLVKNNKKSRGRPKKVTKATRKVNKKENNDDSADKTMDDENNLNISNRNQLNALPLENFEKILNDFAVRDDEEEEKDEINPEDIKDNKKESKSITNTPKKIAKKGRPKKILANSEEADEQVMSPNQQHNENSNNARLDSSPPISGRPKREAGLRASAMIIQTNEIEKTKYQYQYQHSNSNPATPSGLNLAETGQTKLKSSQSFSNFQVPQFSSTVYASLAAVSGMKSPKQFTNSTKLTDLVKKNNYSSKNSNVRQISNTTTLGAMSIPNNCQNGDDDSSNDIQIIEATPKQKSSTKPTISQNKTLDKICPAITEEIMKEHNKTYDTGSSNGTFSNFTRDYIIKWVSEYKHTDEVPFSPGQIPIESYGVKVLNDPQYLIVKSRQESNSSASSSILAPVKPSLPVPKQQRTMTTLELNSNTKSSLQTATNKVKIETVTDSEKAVTVKKEGTTSKDSEQKQQISNNTRKYQQNFLNSSTALHCAISQNSSINNLTAALQYTLAQQQTENSKYFESESTPLLGSHYNHIKSYRPVTYQSTSLDMKIPSFPITDSGNFDKCISPNVSPFENLKLKSEQRQYDLVMPNIPIINVENLNVFSGGAVDESCESTYYHNYQPLDKPKECFSRTDFADISSNSNQAKVAAAAAAAVAFNLAKFLNQSNFHNPQKPTKTTSDMKSEYSHLRSKEIVDSSPIIKSEAIYLSTSFIPSCSSEKTNQTIEIGEDSNDIKNTIHIKTEEIKVETQYMDSNSLSSGSIHLIVDEASETIDTTKFEPTINNNNNNNSIQLESDTSYNKTSLILNEQSSSMLLMDTSQSRPDSFITGRNSELNQSFKKENVILDEENALGPTTFK